MPEDITVAKTLSIRNCGHDEYWLQNKIAADPSILGLGDFELVSRERRQSRGGRLDILLTDPSEESMYAVEVMLGETDESHIIRTLEYWDLEKRRRPNTKHTAVLVAEKITRRFFNVIQLLSQSVPIVAIQANVIEAQGQRSLHFTKILDEYEEPELPITEAPEVSSDNAWQEQAPWTVDCAKSLAGILRSSIPKIGLTYLKNYISLRVGSNGVGYFWLYRRSSGQSLICCWLDDSGWTKAEKLMTAHGIQYIRRKDDCRMVGSVKWVQEHTEFIQQLSAIVSAGIARWNSPDSV